MAPLFVFLHVVVGRCMSKVVISAMKLDFWRFPFLSGFLLKPAQMTALIPELDSFCDFGQISECKLLFFQNIDRGQNFIPT